MVQLIKAQMLGIKLAIIDPKAAWNLPQEVKIYLGQKPYNVMAEQTRAHVEA
jgi:hypothetical protein